MNTLETIDRVMQKRREAETPREQNSWHVGSLSGCLRGAYLKRKGAKGEPLAPHKYRTFEMGNKVEAFVEECPREDGCLVESQGRVEWPELNLTGRFDFLVKDEHGLWVRECKSVHSKSFFWQKKRGGKPSEGKIMQVSMYWRKLREKYPDLHASIIDVDKDTIMVMEYVVPEAEALEYSDLGLANAKILNDCWVNGELPPVPPTIVSEWGKETVNFVAKYCDVHHLCLNDPDWLLKAETECKS